MRQVGFTHTKNKPHVAEVEQADLKQHLDGELKVDSMRTIS